MTEGAPRFGFGRNWEQFIEKHFNPELVDIAGKHLLGFLKMSNLQGKSFIDIGCGSGLHSLAALQAGAAKIVSFDYDPKSVSTTTRLKEYAGNPAHWSVMQGSVLDRAFVDGLSPADIVYSWGVLHHTGEMWAAIENAARPVAPNGLFYIALYQDRPYFDQPMTLWVDVKQRYNRGGWLTKRRTELWYFWEFYLHGKLGALPEVLRAAREYKKARGMAMYTDAKDWLGGWPFEVATVDQVKAFAQDRLGFDLLNLASDQANAEYLFRRR